MVLGKLDIDMRDKVGLLPYTIYKNYSSFPLSTPLQYSCLENPMDGGAWWAAVHGVTQSRTRLKRLSSSSSPLSTGAMFETGSGYLKPQVVLSPVCTWCWEN